MFTGRPRRAAALQRDPMARRPTRSLASNNRQRGAARGPAPEHCLLILGGGIVAALCLGSITHLPWTTPPIARPAPLTMAEARASNALVPIDRHARRRARRFAFDGGPAAREQAVECLATVAKYEAGDDPDEQRA